MRIHIRGQMGVQILQSFVAIGRLHYDETPTIVVNTAGNLPYDATEKLSRVFDPKVVISHQEEFRKTPYWEPGSAALAFQSRDRVLSELLPLKDSMKAPSPTKTKSILHCRGGDKITATAESYEKLFGVAGFAIDRVLSNDAALGEAVASRIGADFYDTTSMEDDWKTILDAERVLAMPSAFVMSTMLIDPAKRIVFGGESFRDGPYEAMAGDLLFIDEAREYCPNVEVLE